MENEREHTLKQLWAQSALHILEDMKSEGVVDAIDILHGGESRGDETFEWFFGRKFSSHSDHRGGPLFQYLMPMRKCETRFVCHFDCDVLLFSRDAYSWVETGIEMIKAQPHIVAAAPCSRPPTDDGTYFQPGNRVAGFGDAHLVNCISTRKFLLDLDWMKSRLPMQAKLSGRKARLKSLLFGSSATLPLENHVTDQMRKETLWRLDVSGADAWSLHLAVHDWELVRVLPRLVQLVEDNVFPREQMGRYDFDIELWRSLLS